MVFQVPARTSKWRQVVAVGACLALSGMFVACGQEPAPSTSGGASASTSTDAKPEFSAQGIRMIVGATAGGGYDRAIRQVEPAMTRSLGTTFNIEYQASADGAVAMQQLAAAKDCNTIVTQAHPKVILGQYIQNVYDYDRDFSTIGAYTRDYSTLMVLDENPQYKTGQELIDAAKAEPGKITIALGSLAGDGLSLFKLQDALGVQFNLVPMGGGTESNNALLGNKVPVAQSSVFNGLALEGKAHPLFVMGPENPLPDKTQNAPTSQEALGTDVQNVQNYVLYVSKSCKTDHPVEYQALSNALRDSLQDADFKKTVAELGQSEWYYFTSPEELDKDIAAQMPVIKKIVEENNLAG